MIDKDKESIIRGLKDSQKGDEILLERIEDGKRKVTYYLAMGEEDFKKANLTETEGKEIFTLEPDVVKGSRILDQLETFEKSRIYWNRRKFKEEEVESLVNGHPFNEYEEITKRYAPMKRMADLRVKIERELSNAKFGDEIIRYKYRNNQRNGAEYYICIGKDGLGNQRYRIAIKGEVNGKKIVGFDSREKIQISNEEIIKKFADSELAPEGKINIQREGSKYSKKDIEEFFNGNLLDDNKITQKRLEWINSEKKYEPDKSRPGMFIVNWYNKENGEKIRQSVLNVEQIMKLRKKGIIKPEESKGIQRESGNKDMQR